MYIRRAISVISAVLILVIIAITITSIYYVQLISVPKPSLESIEIIDTELVKNYAYIRFTIKIHNAADEHVNVTVSIFGEDGNVLSTSALLTPRTTNTIVLEGMYGHLFLVDGKYLVTVTGISTRTTKVICKGIEMFHGKVYVLSPYTLPNLVPNSLTKGGDIKDPSMVVKAISDIAKKFGIPLRPLESLSEWKYVVENPPKNVIILNPFGGILPIPPEYIDNPLEFIEKLGNNVRKYGWIWVHLTGYPFYYVSDGEKIIKVHKHGLGSFLFGNPHRNVVAGCGAYQTYQQTSNNDLRSWITNLGYKDIADKLLNRLRIHYSLNLKHIPNEWVLSTIYLNPGKSQSGAIVLSIGEGLYIHWGSIKEPKHARLDDHELGLLGMLTALYIKTQG